MEILNEPPLYKTVNKPHRRKVKSEFSKVFVGKVAANCQFMQMKCCRGRKGQLTYILNFYLKPAETNETSSRVSL